MFNARVVGGAVKQRSLVAAAGAVALLAFSACAGSAPRTAQTQLPAPQPPATQSTVHSLSADAAPQKSAPKAVDWGGPVTVAQLTAAAHTAHPTMAAVAAARAAAQARAAGATVWANPELELTWGRARARSDDHDQANMYGGSLSQRIEWWSKRRARQAAAQAEVGVSDAEARVALAALDGEVARAAIAYAGAQVAVEYAIADALLATQVVALAEARLTAGDLDRAAFARVRLDATMAGVQRDARQHEAVAALDRLRRWCDPAVPAALAITDALPVIPELHLRSATAALSRASTTEATSPHPQLQAARAAAAAAQAHIAAEQRAAIPDFTVGVFADRDGEEVRYGLSLGFELPVWNRNHDRIAVATAEYAAAVAAVQVENARFANDLAELTQIATAALAEASALQHEAVPAANEAVRLRLSAFAGGSAGFSDIMESRRAAVAVNTALLDARRRAAEAQVAIAQLLGSSASVIPQAAALPQPTSALPTQVQP